MSTVTPKSLLENKSEVMVKTKSVPPASPSLAATSSIESNAMSSLMMVPSPLASLIVARLASTAPSNNATDRSTENVSSISTIWSPVTLTVIVVESEPMAMTAGWFEMDA